MARDVGEVLSWTGGRESSVQDAQAIRSQPCAKGCEMLAMKHFVGLLWLATTACGLQIDEQSSASLGESYAPLHLAWHKTSHNTYETGHHLGGLGTVLGVHADHIELDLQQISSLSGNDWAIAHTSAASSVTTACTGGGLLSHCLADIAAIHRSRPLHPLYTVWLDKKNDWSGAGFSPARLDELISNAFTADELVRPSEISAGYALRSIVQLDGWPTHLGTRGRVMFVMTSDAGCTGNNRLEAYVDARGHAANVFIAPSGEQASYVTTQPNCFDAASTNWVAIYNFEWQSGAGDECNAGTCYQLPAAHDRRFLTRVWDIDDPGEYDSASERPWGGSYGHANFIAIDYPWQQGGAGGYGFYVEGEYPW